MCYYLNDFHQETSFRLWLVGKRKMFRDLSRALDLPTSESLACAAPFRFSFQGRAAVQPQPTFLARRHRWEEDRQPDFKND